jgi:hypothetical protein
MGEGRLGREPKSFPSLMGGLKEGGLIIYRKETKL